MALQTPPVNLLLRLAPGVSSGYSGLAGRDVHGVLDVLHRRQLLAWQVADDEGIAWATLVPLRREVALPVPGGWTAEPTTPL